MVGCTHQGVLVAAVVLKEAKAAAVGLAEVEAGWVVKVVTAGSAVGTGVRGLEAVAMVEMVVVGSVKVVEAVRAAVDSVVEQVVPDSVEVDSAAVDWVVVATGLVAGEAEESCEPHRHKCTQSHSRIQRCGCI